MKNSLSLQGLPTYYVVPRQSTSLELMLVQYTDHFATRSHDSQGEVKYLMMNVFAAFYSALYFSLLQLSYLDYQGSLFS